MEYPSHWNGFVQDMRTRVARLAEAKDFLSRLVSDADKELAAISKEKGTDKGGIIMEINRVHSLMEGAKYNLQRIDLEMAELQHLIFQPVATIGIAKLSGVSSHLTTLSGCSKRGQHALG